MILGKGGLFRLFIIISLFVFIKLVFIVCKVHFKQCLNFINVLYCRYRVGNEIAQWLIDKKIIEHIFGPNLHAEVSWCNIIGLH